ncbi:MAG: glycosyltransferase family 1 protein [Armatimonadetes bacterium]|nr:glycosyltransferase family 1 protein [Armatimonadota bacterium]
MQWLEELAPVRVGIVPESMRYSKEDHKISTQLGELRPSTCQKLPHLTHVLVADEADVEDLRRDHPGLRYLWWPMPAPARFSLEPRLPSPNAPALFIGNVYGERLKLLERPDFARVLHRLRPPEDGTLYPGLFDALHEALEAHFAPPGVSRRTLTEIAFPFLKRFRVRRLFKGGAREDARETLRAYLQVLRLTRRGIYRSMLRAQRQGSAVVNLPHYVHTYAGRVIEGISAGCPIISWRIPNRPRNEALFEDGKEILLYERTQPLQLVEQIERVRRDPGAALKIARQAQAKFQRFHTTEARVGQILHWLDSGAEPSYG